MQSSKDTEKIVTENDEAYISIYTVLGDRTEQQDCFGYVKNKNECFLVICDGMGGKLGGKQSSQTAVNQMLTDFDSDKFIKNAPDTYLQMSRKANEAVCSLKKDNGEPLGAGSTLISVFINNNKMFWCSIGDSRAYLIRKGQIVQVTQDQNYNAVLSEKLKKGLIRKEEFDSENRKGDALISFLGMSEGILIDYNERAFNLVSGDVILLMSDGLYKTLSMEEMSRIIENFNNVNDAINALELKAVHNAKKNRMRRDNTTVAIIKVK